MARNKTIFVCRSCGRQEPKWAGRCPECGTWDSMEPVERPSTRSATAMTGPVPLTLDQVQASEARRLSTGLAELDRVLGGGAVPGSVVLLSGEPGVGKSTLLLQAAAGLAASRLRLLYVSGEESPAQIRLRAERLHLDPSRLLVLAESRIEAIVAAAEEHPWDVLAVDSIQSVASADITSGPGSLAQIRESAGRLIQVAKTFSRPVWLVGHVTKEGSIAGPKVLEHMVDTVLYFEGGTRFQPAGASGLQKTGSAPSTRSASLK